MTTRDTKTPARNSLRSQVKLSPSLLAADFTRLGEEIAAVSSADMLHVDVMDGHFVPNITFGPSVVQAVHAVTDLPLDVHLMISNPGEYIEAFVRSGASVLTLSAEACLHMHRLVHQVKNLGAKVGIALNPATSLSVLDHVLEDIDQVLIMTVNPGFGGQKFIPSMITKIRALREQIAYRGLSVDIEVDGGIDQTTIASVVQAGANVVVAGSAIFGAENRADVIRQLRGACSN